jgi:polyisoprenoid-binding protein YceI
MTATDHVEHPMTITTTADVRAGLYRIDVAHSQIMFRATGLFGLPVRGTFAIREGTVDVAATATGSTVWAIVDLASFASNNRRRDADVRSRRFLDVANYPDLIFTGRAVGDQAAVIEGTLDRHGTTAPTSMRVAGVERTPTGYEITASARVDRYALGVTRGKGIVGRYLDLTLRVALTAP